MLSKLDASEAKLICDTVKDWANKNPADSAAPGEQSGLESEEE